MKTFYNLTARLRMWTQQDELFNSFNCYQQIKEILETGKYICMLGDFSCIFLLTFFIFFSRKFFKENYQSVKRFGSRSGPTFCRSWSGHKLFTKVISRWQKLLLASIRSLYCRVKQKLEYFKTFHFHLGKGKFPSIPLTCNLTLLLNSSKWLLIYIHEWKVQISLI